MRPRQWPAVPSAHMGIRRKEASMRTSKTIFLVLIIGSAVAIRPKYLETYATYGDDVIVFGPKLSPAARRLLTHNPRAPLPILRRYGTKTAELEDGKKGTKPHGRADPQKSHRLRRQDAGRFSADCRSSPDGNSSRSHAFPRKCSQRESSSPSTKASISTTVGTGQHTFAFRRRKQEENGHRTGDKKLYAAIVFGSMLS